MSRVWFTADLHLGHAAIATIRAVNEGIARLWDHSPEADAHDIAWHDRTLAANWDNHVQPDDHVWILGDLALGGTEATARALNWITDRPGQKHLIPGNHDPIHPMHRDSHRWHRAYAEAFLSVQAFARRRINGTTVLLSHLPYSGDHTAEDRYSQYRLRDHGEWLLHGHTHNPAWYAPLRHARQIHVGLDAWELKPASLEDITALMEGNPR